MSLESSKVFRILEARSMTALRRSFTHQFLQFLYSGQARLVRVGHFFCEVLFAKRRKYLANQSFSRARNGGE